MLIPMNKEMKTWTKSSFKRFKNYTKQSGNNSRKVKHYINLSMIDTWLIISSRLETGYGFTSARNDLRVKERNSSLSDMDPSLS